MLRNLSSEELKRVMDERKMIEKVAGIFYILILAFFGIMILSNIISLTDDIQVSAFISLLIDIAFIAAVTFLKKHVRKLMYSDIDYLRACDVVILEKKLTTDRSHDPFTLRPSSKTRHHYRMQVADINDRAVGYDVTHVELSFGDRHEVGDEVVLIKDTSDETGKAQFLIDKI